MTSHGTRSAYVRGCHCPECLEAHRKYMREYFALRKKMGIVNRKYCGLGRTNYAYGCRCPACVQAAIEYNRQYRLKHKPIEVSHDNGDIAPPAL